MPLLPLSMAIALTNVLSLAAIFGFLYHRSREPHLLLWSLSWVGHSLRYLASLLSLLQPGSLLLPLLEQWFSLAAGGLLVWGTAVFVAGCTPRCVRVLWVGTLAAAVWPLFAAWRDYSFLWANLPTYVVLAAALILTGIAFLRWPRIDGPGRVLAGWGMVAWGIHTLDYPLLAPRPDAAPWVYVIATILGIAVAAGVVLAHLDRERRQVLATESRLQLLAENASDLLFRYRFVPEPGFDYVSPAATSMVGYTPEEHYADPELGLKLVHPDDRHIFASLLAEAVAPGTTVELRWLHRSGRVVWVEQKLNPIFDAGGRYIGLAGVARDVTERAQAAQALAASEARYRRLYHSVHASVMTCDAEGRVLDANANAQRLLGVSLEEKLVPCRATTGRLQLIREDGSPLPADQRPCALALRRGGTVSDSVVGVVGTDGSVRWVLASAEVDRTQGSDSPPTVVVTCVDITERKRLEDVWRESDRRFRDILQGVDVMAYQLDREGNIVFCNEHLLKTTGWTTPELLGRNWFDTFVAEEVREERRRRWSEHVADGKGSRRSEYEILTRTGEPRLVRWNRTWLLDEHGQVEGAASIGEDITQVRALERQLEQAQKLESIGRLAGGVAHDFNNLLTAVAGYASLALSAAPPDPGLKDDMMEILAAADRGAQLTKRLLTVARQAHGETRAVDLSRLVLDLQKFLRRLIREDITITIAVDTAPAVIMADTSQLEQVLMNLVVNARDAMPEGGTLTIDVGNVSLDEAYAATHAEARPGEFVALTVSDSGVGMDATVKARLFEPFFTTKELGQGTGLGLSVVYGIVRQYGGSIWVDSEPGQGTTFTLYFPRAVDVDVAATDPEHVKPAIVGGDETILLVEDEAPVRDITARILESLGYTVAQASSGPEAIALAERLTGPIDLLLTDVVMPRMSGPDLAEAFRVHWPDLAVLYVSGFTKKAIARQGVLGPEEWFLAKPYSHGVLAARVRAAIDARGQAAASA